MWAIPGAQCAYPSATQNEINQKDARNLLKSGVYVIGEGANIAGFLKVANSMLDQGLV